MNYTTLIQLLNTNRPNWRNEDPVVVVEWLNTP